MSASSTAPAALDALLAHLFASRFARTFAQRLLRRRFPMTFPRGVDWAPALTFPRGFTNCHWLPPVEFLDFAFAPLRSLDHSVRSVPAH